MKVVWRKRFIDPHTEGIYWLLQKDPNTRLLNRCFVCHCPPREWYVAVACPCNLCGTSSPDFIGQDPSEGYGGGQTTVEWGPDANVYVAKVLHMDWHYAGPNKTSWQHYRIRRYAILLGIKHYAAISPITGTLEADLLINGNIIASWSRPCESNKRYFIGDGLPGEGGTSSNSWYIGRVFNESGIYAVDLVVKYVGGTPPEVKYVYTCRVGIEVYNYHDYPYIGSVKAVPYYYELDDPGICTMSIVVNNKIIYLYDKILLGPYSSKEDAEFVINTWDEIISCYAITCACPTRCLPDEGGLWADPVAVFGYIKPDPVPEWVDSSYLDAKYGCRRNNDCGLVGGCDYYPVLFLFENDDCHLWKFYAFAYNENSEEVGQVQSGFVIPPCWRVEIRLYCGGIWDGDPHAAFNAVYLPLGREDPCCLEDDQSPFYQAAWRYDPNTGEGVPHNSGELEHWRENWEA